MLILGIETSCDETSVALVEDGTRVLSNVISSSRKTFENLAGVIPEQAARMQVECMIPVLEEALKQAGVTMQQIDAIAVTKGPGLLGSLLVGTTTARALASVHRKPLIGVHHTLGHLSSTWLESGLTIRPSDHSHAEGVRSVSFPILTLSASGGHTDLWYRTSHTRGALLGRTRDDAAGEAFDKGASLLGLPYPGGPSIQKAAEGGNSHAYQFPLPLHQEETLDFSFSGLKTALKYLLRDLHQSHAEGMRSGNDHRTIGPSDIAASYQHALCSHLTDRIHKALRTHPDVAEVHFVGGVSSNTYLRSLTAGVPLLRVPQKPSYCTDNAAMIAGAGYFLWKELGRDAYAPFETAASIPLEEIRPRASRAGSPRE